MIIGRLPQTCLLDLSPHSQSLFPSEKKKLIFCYAPHNGKLCSVGGADYGSVRIGAFMGREIIKSTASAKLCKFLSVANGTHTDELEEDSLEPLEAEKSLDYLCNLSPHR